jgi:CRISPR-associated protein Csx3
MKTIQLNLYPHQTQDALPYQHLRVQITTDDGIIEPEDLKGLKLPSGIDFSQGIVVEGKGPIWLYAYLVHECHAATWVGCYDPRHKGAIVVETHSRTVSVGQVLKLGCIPILQKYQDALIKN